MSQITLISNCSYGTNRVKWSLYLMQWEWRRMSPTTKQHQHSSVVDHCCESLGSRIRSNCDNAGPFPWGQIQLPEIVKRGTRTCATTKHVHGVSCKRTLLSNSKSNLLYKIHVSFQEILVALGFTAVKYNSLLGLLHRKASSSGFWSMSKFKCGATYHLRGRRFWENVV